MKAPQEQKQTTRSENESTSEKLERLQRELQEMREELEATTRGTLALYNEIDNKNAELERHHRELSRKNEELSRALADLKESEDARIKAARTAAIGNIVVTYNHEINNPLAVIIASLDMLSRHHELETDEYEQNLEKIRRAAARIQDVVSKIKQYEKLLPKSYIHWDTLDLQNGDQDT